MEEDRKIVLDLAQAVEQLQANPALAKAINETVLGTVAADQIAEMQNTIDELVASLLKYGRHTNDCSSHFGPECYCGWPELKRELVHASAFMKHMRGNGGSTI